MNDFYKNHKDYEITLNFYECESRITLEDFINLVKSAIENTLNEVEDE